jgi:hypothetical protein
MLRALLLQLLYSLRSEWLLMEALRYNLLFRWFVGLDRDTPLWGVTSFTKEPEPVARRLGSPSVLSAGPGACQDSAPFVRRTFHSRWPADRSLGEPEGFQAEAPPPDDPSSPSVGFRPERRMHAYQSRDIRILPPSGPLLANTPLSQWSFGDACAGS